MHKLVGATLRFLRSVCFECQLTDNDVGRYVHEIFFLNFSAFFSSQLNFYLFFSLFANLSQGVARILDICMSWTEILDAEYGVRHRPRRIRRTRREYVSTKKETLNSAAVAETQSVWKMHDSEKPCGLVSAVAIHENGCQETEENLDRGGGSDIPVSGNDEKFARENFNYFLGIHYSMLIDTCSRSSPVILHSSELGPFCLLTSYFLHPPVILPSRSFEFILLSRRWLPLLP